MGRWLSILLHCDRCSKDVDYLWDQTYENIAEVICPTCGHGNMWRKFTAANVMLRALPDGTYRGEEFERCKRLANLQCELGEHFHGTDGYKEVASEIVANGGNPNTGDPARS